MTIPRFFFFIFDGETFDDLANVKRGLSKMGSISSLHHSSMTKNLWRCHASTLISTIIALIRLNNGLWWPPKIKKGHGQTVTISGLNQHCVTKNLWKFHESTPIGTIATLIPVTPPNILSHMTFDGLMKVKRGHSHNI